MKSHVVALAVLIAANGVGMPNGPGRSPIVYWIHDITYSKSITEAGSGDYITEIDWGGKVEERFGTKDTDKTSVQVEAGIKVDGHVTYTTGGGFSSGGSIRRSAGIKFGWEKIHDQEIEEMRQRYFGAAKKVKEEGTVTSGDSQLWFNLNFHNVSTNQTFEYKGNGKLSGLTVVVPDEKGSLHRIAVVLSGQSKASEENLLLDGFTLRANGGERSIPIVATIKNATDRAILRFWEIRGELNKKASIRFDDSFHLVNKETEALWDYNDINTCKIDVTGADINANLPIVVDCRGLTYSNILEIASSKLPAEYRFSFSADGTLDKAFGFRIGQFAKDGKGVYVVLVDENGKVKDKLYRDDLNKEPSSQNRNNALRFMRQGLKDVYTYRNLYPDSVISNCLSFVVNSKNVRDEDLFVCAMLSSEKGDYALFGRFLSRMEKVDGFLNTEEDKALALRLIIQSDNIEYFKNLYSRLGWMDKYDGKERTMLGYAAEMGSLNIVKWLLEEAPEHERPNVNGLVPSENKKPTGDAGKTPLFWAAKNGHLEVCQYLVSKGAGFKRKFYEEKNGEAEEYDELVDKSYISDDGCRKYIEAEREVLDVGNRFFSGLRDPRATGEKIRDWVEAGVPPERSLGGDWNLLSWAVELQDDSLVEFLTGKERSNDVRGLLLEAKEGNAAAMNDLGCCYLEGDGVRAIHKVAFYWFSKAADLNNIDGLYNCAYCLDRGLGVKKDSDKAKEYLEKRNRLLEEKEKE